MSSITTRTLRCGTPLIVEVMSGVRSAALAWLLPVGSASDPAPLEGISSLWSELLLRGAGTRSSREHADAMDRIGASTVSEVGSHTLRVGTTTLGSRLHEAIPLLADMVLRPLMEESAVEPCRDLAQQALESVADDPQERASLLLRERHHPTPLNRSGLGTVEGLKAITHRDLVLGWPRAAVPQRSIIAAAGAVDPDALVTLFDALLVGWTGATSEPAIGPTPPRGYAHEEDDSNQVQVLLAYDAPPEPDDSSVLERIVLTVLSGGMSGRLFTEVREKRGLCYAVSAGYRGDRDYGVVSAYVGTTPERAQESLDVLAAELLRITTPAGAVTPEEFERARVGMKAALVFSGESTGARAVGLAGDYRRLGRARSLEEIAVRIDRVTLDELNAYLATRRLGLTTIQTLGPKPLKPPATL